jgi:CDP-4-dehydro-6-deoxyglucose reductase
MQVTLRPEGTTFPVAPGETLLAAGLRAGLALPHSCRGGRCGSCRARLIAGPVHYPRGDPDGLTADERASGWTLMCQAHAAGDLVLEARPVRPAGDVEIRSLPARVERLERRSADVVALWLRLPAIEPFRFAAGQYVDLLLPGGRRRSYSIASPAHDSARLELHVAHVPGGAFSTRVHDGLRPGDLLRLEGPFGTATWPTPLDHAPPGAPLVLVTGGTGFAPAKAILRTALEAADGDERPVRLYRVARSAADLYDDDWVRTTAERWPRLAARAVRPEEVIATLRDAMPRPAVLYAAGPPGLVEELAGLLPALGLAASAFLADAFVPAEDPAGR